MRYLTGYYYEERNGPAGESLLLEQVRCGRRGAALAVLGRESEGAHPVRELREWFQEAAPSLCRKSGDAGWERKVEERLVEERLGKAMVFPLVGMFLLDDRFWLFRKGGGGLYLLNRSFLRSHIRKLRLEPVSEPGREMQDCDMRDCGLRDCATEDCGPPGILRGSVEKGIGLLLASDVYLEGVTPELIKQCLAVSEIRREQQISNRLQELASLGDRGRSPSSFGAVYLRTV